LDAKICAPVPSTAVDDVALKATHAMGQKLGTIRCTLMTLIGREYVTLGKTSIFRGFRRLAGASEIGYHP
jgi:hypothetical protein